MMFYTNVARRGNNILLRGIRDGKRIQEKIQFKPTLYVRSQTPTNLTNINGEYLEKKQFDSMSDAREFISKFSKVENFPIFGNTNYIYPCITKMFPGDIEFDITQMKIITIDIETTTEYGFPDTKNPNEQVQLITIQDYNTKEITSFGCGAFLPYKKNITYIRCQDEYDLLKRFIKEIKSDYPDVITGWNCQFFDIAYLSARITKILGESSLKELSAWGMIDSREVEFAAGRTEMIYEWVGTSTLDYLDLYKKFAYTQQENYKLDTVAKSELGKEKLKHQFESFKDFYTYDWQKFVEYNIVDVELVDQLEDNRKLINLILTMAYDAKCNYSDIFSPVKTWDCILFNALWKKNIMVNHVEPPEHDRQILGAYVKEPTPGRYDWVVSFDATSLYPSIIMTLNMSPDTLVNGQKFLPDVEQSIEELLDKRYDTSHLQKNNWSMAANGQAFTKDKKGFFPEIVEYYFDARQKAKRIMLDAEKSYQETKDPKWKSVIATMNSKQMAAKILMNSLYGAMGNKFFRYYDNRIAEGITMTGQLVIRTVARSLNKFLNLQLNTKDQEYSFYSDTDSTYITLKDIVAKHYNKLPTEEVVEALDNYCNELIQPAINEATESLSDYINVHQRKLKFKREIIADRGVWIAKKRYAVNVHNSEGVAYKEPKLKVMGMEIVRTSTPQSVRDRLKKAVNIVLTKDQDALRAFVKQAEQEWKKLSIADISFPRGVNGLSTYYDKTTIFKKGTPIHVRGALLYNYLLVEKEITKKYARIQEGEKIKFCYMKEPNPLGTHVISFVDQLPPEFHAEDYIDYDTMFEKAFLEPLNSLLSCVGWSIKEKASLEELFA
jgi:DNA polymerase elongation subunit (family B)